MKRPRNFYLFFCAFFLLFSASCFAQNRQSQTAAKPDFSGVSQDFLSDYFLIGAASLKFLGMKVYDISLFAAEQKFSYEKPFAIRIKYNLSFDKEELAKRSVVEIKRFSSLTKEEEQNYFSQLLAVFHSVKKGDEKIAFFSPSEGVSMIYNGQKIGEISDKKLARLFVDIWLNLRGSYPDVTKKILGM